jgi:serine/threonine-protein kinase RsbW
MARNPRRARAAAGPRRAVRPVRMLMASSRSAVAPMVDRVLEAVRGARLTEEQRDDLAVAVAEALSNAAVHGNRLEPQRRVRVEVRVTPDGGATVDVADSGGGFDSAAAPDPTDPARVLIPGGRGVFLMRRLVDRLEYNEAGNSVRMTLYGPRSRR